jgi:uncharacterized membrane protein (DUF485 family)
MSLVAGELAYRESSRVDDNSEHGSNAETDHSGDLSCELCDEDHAAAMRCLDCRQNMCDVAVKLHRRTKSTKGHRLMPVHDCMDEDNCSLLATDMCIVCPQHQDTYRYYDRDCGHCICRDCFALTHTGHKCVTSGVAAKEFRVELEKSTRETKLKIESFQIAEKALEEINRNLSVRYNELNEKLETTFEQVSLFLFILFIIIVVLIPFFLLFLVISFTTLSSLATKFSKKNSMVSTKRKRRQFTTNERNSSP